MNKLKTYASFVKFEHTLFSLPLILGGAWLAAGGAPPLKIILLTILAGTGARTAAFGLNRMIDREIDGRNPRTANRELPAGRMRVTEAWLVTLTGIAVYIVCAALICPFVLQWSWLPLVIFAVYPYLKRFTVAAHWGIGLA
ncbi:MAG: UbiA family prenyltransferase, partial [bacterium]